ncbi:nucleoside phosphorylase [Lunatibacter salilacus]|uniref:nucleoside phosphorylase n=1 Tax=Lunatibacter salilacus TaxID=2483804 RepID=UPI00131C7240|nr:nucleoside phosphorylase [Lunatibacter salilacus]
MSQVIPESELIINPDGSIYHLNLKPEHLAGSILAVGDPDRVAKISKHFDKIEYQGGKREFITHTGTFRGKRISVISTGMGTDNIEIFMTELDALVNVDLETRIPKKTHTVLEIVRVGTSGSMQEDIPIDSLLASTHAVGLDSLMTFYSLDHTLFETNLMEQVRNELKLPFTPYCVTGSARLIKKLGKELMSGITVTCPGFFAPQGRKVRLEPAIPGIIHTLSSIQADGNRLSNFEMETAGYYAMGRLLGHEVLSLNAIIGNRISQTFSKNPDLIVENLILHALNNF